MIEKKRLIEYLPPFIKQFPEMQEIMKSENKETDIADKKMSEVLDNAFIESCDGYGIKKYENMLEINPSDSDTLELRKTRVLNRWNDTVPYTYKVLLRRLNIFCGVNNFDISGNLKDYELFITTNLFKPGQVKEFEIMLDRLIPVNIYLRTDNKAAHDISGKESIGGNVTYTRMRTIGKAV